MFHLERGQEAVVNAFLQRVDVHGLAEVRVGVAVVLALRRRGQTKLYRRCEVLEDRAPVALVVCATAVALVDDDEVEEVRRVVTEVRAGLAILGRPAHEGLEDREEDAAVLRDLALLADVTGSNADERVFGESRERVVGLIGEDVAIRQEQDTRAARRLSAQVPA